MTQPSRDKKGTAQKGVLSPLYESPLVAGSFTCANDPHSTPKLPLCLLTAINGCLNEKKRGSGLEGGQGRGARSRSALGERQSQEEGRKPPGFLEGQRPPRKPQSSGSHFLASVSGPGHWPWWPRPSWGGQEDVERAKKRIVWGTEDTFSCSVLPKAKVDPHPASALPPSRNQGPVVPAPHPHPPPPRDPGQQSQAFLYPGFFI